MRVVKKVQREIKQTRRNRFPVNEDVLLEQMPAARTHDERGRLVVEAVRFGGRRKLDRPANRINEIRLSFDVVGPRRRMRVFEIGHKDARAGVQRIDDHLPIDRTGDLHAAVRQIGRNRRNRPVAVANLFRLA